MTDNGAGQKKKSGFRQGCGWPNPVQNACYGRDALTGIRFGGSILGELYNLPKR